jgi:hypothetical protein
MVGMETGLVEEDRGEFRQRSAAGEEPYKRKKYQMMTTKAQEEQPPPAVAFLDLWTCSHKLHTREDFPLVCTTCVYYGWMSIITVFRIFFWGRKMASEPGVRMPNLWLGRTDGGTDAGAGKPHP